MKLSTLAISLAVFTFASAQDPRIAKDPRVARAGAPDPQTPQEPFNPSDLPIEDDTSTAALTSPKGVSDGSKDSGGIFGLGKKIFDSTIMGKPVLEDPAEQARLDKEDGVERISKTNWDEKVKGSDPQDAFVALIIGPPRNQLDLHFYDAHKNATKMAHDDGGIDKIRWARIDYVQEVELCTKWLVWKTPVLLMITDQGKNMRFFQKWQLAQGGEGLYEIVKSGDWEDLEIWNSRWGPGGDRHWIIEQYIDKSQKWSNATSGIPNIVWVIGVGWISQTLIQWLHSSKTPKPTAQVKATTTEDKATSAARKAVAANRAKIEKEAREKEISAGSSGTSTSTPTSAKKRK